MPFPRPTLTQLRALAMQDIVASDLPNADGFLRRSALRVLAWVQAGLANLHYGYLDWIARNAVPFTAQGEFLEGWAALAPTPVIRQAPVAAGSPVVTFQAASSSTIPAGALLSRSDGTQYATVASSSTVAGVITVAVTAVVAGAAGNADAGTPLQLSGVISGVNGASGVAVQEIIGGTDLETDVSLKSRMLESYADPPAGGSAADYVTWALAVPGVTRAWTLGNGMGPGSVVVYAMMDAVNASLNGFPRGIAGTATAEPRAASATLDLLTIANAIYPLQPVSALVFAAAPGSQAVNFTIAGLASVGAAQQAAVRSAIAARMTVLANPLAGTSIEQSDIESAVAALPGLPSFAITVPSSWPLTPSVGSLLVPGTVTFV